MKTLIAALVALSAIATAATAAPFPSTFDGPAFGPKDIAEPHGPAFGPSDIRSFEGPGYQWESANQR